METKTMERVRALGVAFSKRKDPRWLAGVRTFSSWNVHKFCLTILKKVASETPFAVVFI